jgi:hypothetical protein
MNRLPLADRTRSEQFRSRNGGRPPTLRASGKEAAMQVTARAKGWGARGHRCRSRPMRIATGRSIAPMRGVVPGAGGASTATGARHQGILRPPPSLGRRGIRVDRRSRTRLRESEIHPHGRCWSVAADRREPRLLVRPRHANAIRAWAALPHGPVADSGRGSDPYSIRSTRS